MKDEKRKSCPCEILDEPCMTSCTCKHSALSGGCLCCAKYGSLEQRKNAAEHIQKAMKEYHEKLREKANKKWKK